MASCTKCGKARLSKNTLGAFSCPRCGVRPAYVVQAVTRAVERARWIDDRTYFAQAAARKAAT